jgi:hypothetical protein
MSQRLSLSSQSMLLPRLNIQPPVTALTDPLHGSHPVAELAAHDAVPAAARARAHAVHQELAHARQHRGNDPKEETARQPDGSATSR